MAQPKMTLKGANPMSLQTSNQASPQHKTNNTST